MSASNLTRLIWLSTFLLITEPSFIYLYWIKIDKAKETPHYLYTSSHQWIISPNHNPPLQLLKMRLGPLQPLSISLITSTYQKFYSLGLLDHPLALGIFSLVFTRFSKTLYEPNIELSGLLGNRCWLSARLVGYWETQIHISINEMSTYVLQYPEF